MSATETAVVPAKAPKPPVAIGNKGIVLEDMDGLVRFSAAVAASGLAPKGIQTETAIFVAIQMGLEVGLTPMAALQNIAVINGRPSIWGDAQLAIVRGTGQLEEFEEWFEQNGQRLPRNPATYTDTTAAVCRVKRQGAAPTEVGFSVQDAKTAGLWGKEGPWRQYPFRMLRSRARSFALRDTFGDALKGILSAEENSDLPPIEVESRVIPADAPKTEGVSIARQRKPRTEPTETQVKPAETQTPPAPAKPADTLTADALAEFLEKNGVPFDEFKQWAVQIGVLSSAEDDCASVDALPLTTLSLLTPNDLRKCALLKGKTPEGLGL